MELGYGGEDISTLTRSTAPDFVGNDSFSSIRQKVCWRPHPYIQLGLMCHSNDWQRTADSVEKVGFEFHARKVRA
jgi:hypothetical protein